jgi:hypothetical protein
MDSPELIGHCPFNASGVPSRVGYEGQLNHPSSLFTSLLSSSSLNITTSISFPSPTAMSSSKDDVLQFLDSLDSNDTPATDATGGQTSTSSSAARDRTASSTSVTSGGPGGANVAEAGAQDEQSVLDFLDEITQSASSDNKATPPTSTNAQKSSMYDSSALPSRYLQQQQHQPAAQQADSRSSWLGSLWSSASEAVKTTQTAVQSSVKATMESQAGKNFEERVKGFVNAENIGKIGMLKDEKEDKGGSFLKKQMDGDK